MTHTLGPYELRGELGRGAMAIVWRAFDTRLEREVALKEPMLPAGIDEATASEMGARFVREGKAAAGLNHPGIVTIYAADVYDSRPAIVMELIEGETLSDVLSRGALPPGAALAITDQLLDAAGYAHARGVVHRDIKPDNVFVTHDGRVKLADFGIAHMGTTAALTQAGTVMGTPGYMAPEQVTGQPVDARADLFAIGVLAHEMLSGSNPFGATDGVAPTTVMYRIVHEQMPQLPPVVLSGLPPHLTAVLATATAKDPGDRFGDAQAFRAALAGGAIVTARIAAGPYPGNSAPTSAWSSAAAATVVSPASAKSNWTPYIVVGAVMVVVVGLLMVFATGGTRGGVPAGTVSSPTTQPVSPDPAAAAQQPTAPQPEAAVEAAVRDWAAALGRGDLAGHMSYYADTVDYFKAPGTSNSKIWSGKKKALANYSRFVTELDDLSVTMTAPDEAVVTYLKTSVRYKSDGSSSSASVRDRLILRLFGTAWKIIDEKDE